MGTQRHRSRRFMDRTQVRSKTTVCMPPSPIAGEGCPHITRHMLALTNPRKEQQVSNFKTLHGVRLQPCCIATIDKINQRIKKGNALQIVAPACIFAQMFLGPPKSEIATVYSVSTADWGMLAEMVKGIATATNRSIAGDAALEMDNHPSGQLGDFWTGIFERFSSR